MDTEQYQKNLNFFREVLKFEIDYWVNSLFNMIKEHINVNSKLALSMKKRSPIQYDDYLWLSKLDKKDQDKVNRLVRESVSSAFIYFFRRLELGEKNDDGQLMTFKLTMINEETKEETVLIDGTEESQVDNNFQEWILENCSNLKTE